MIRTLAFEYVYYERLPGSIDVTRECNGRVGYVGVYGMAAHWGGLLTICLHSSLIFNHNTSSSLTYRYTNFSMNGVCVLISSRRKY